MADILCLKGDAAFSAFRLQRLLARLTAAVADIESVTADYWHVIAQKLPKVAISRLALGIPAGSAIAFSDPVTLGRAIRGRTEA